jgi:hypothetical protein
VPRFFYLWPALCRARTPAWPGAPQAKYAEQSKLIARNYPENNVFSENSFHA